MKKLLLILALLTYVAISCEKPETTNVDEPETEQPAAVGPSAADTCRIEFEHVDFSGVVMVYKTSSDNVDFEASVNSIFKHYTITLKNGFLDSNAIYTNRALKPYPFPSDTGDLNFTMSVSYADSLKYGSYIVVMWCLLANGFCWGPNCFDSNQRFLYRDIVFDSTHTVERFTLDHELDMKFYTEEPLLFTEF